MTAGQVVQQGGMSMEMIGAIGGFVVIGTGIFLFIKFLPLIKKILMPEQEEYEIEEEVSLEPPLAEVFLDYKQNSVREWISWIKSQDHEKQDAAFAKLKTYINRNAESLGMIASEALKAMAELNHENSYDEIATFMGKLRSSWGRYKHVKSLYENSAEGLIALDENRAFDTLKTEVNHIKSKSDSGKVAKLLTDGILKTKYDAKVEDFALRALTDPQLPFDAKFAIVGKLVKLPEDDRVQAFTKVLELYMSSAVPQLVKDDTKILKFIQEEIRKFISRGNKDLLGLVLDAAENKKTKAIFSEMVAGLIKDPNLEFSQEDIILLLKKPEPAKTLIVESLCHRQEIDAKEQASLSFKAKQEDFAFKKKALNFEKPKRKFQVPGTVYPVLEQLRNALFTQDKKNKAARSCVMPVFYGDANNEKIFLARALSFEEQVNFVYVDMKQILEDNQELSSLKTNLYSYKPAIVMFDNMKDFFDMELDSNTKPKVRVFSKIISEMIKEPSLHMFATVCQKAETYTADSYYKTLFKNETRGKYSNELYLDLADHQFKDDVLREMINNLTEERKEGLNELELISYLVEETDGSSKLEFMSFVTNYFAYSVLGIGKCVKPGEYNDVKYQFQCLAVDDDKQKHLAHDFNMLTEGGDAGGGAMMDDFGEYNELEALNAPPADAPAAPVNGIEALEAMAEDVELDEPSSPDVEDKHRFSVI